MPKLTKTQAKDKTVITRLLGSVWLFPAILFVLVCILSALRISGSSLNVYDQLLQYRAGNENVIYGEPQTVRSDEWLVNTPFIVSQSENNFPVVNKDAVNEQDVSLGVDVPYREWSTLFKPQNLSFFVLPLENAFAFKWWFIGFVLAVSVYLFVLFLLPKRRLVASILALFTLMSPFVQWWYQSGTLLPIAYTLLSVMVAYKITQSRDTHKRILLSALLAYLLACFALILYPPYLIVCAGVGLLLFLSIYLGNGHKINELLKNKTWIYFSVVVVSVLAVVFLFLIQHKEAVSAISSTTYPGNRSIPAGYISFMSLLIWPLEHTLLDQNNLKSYGDNQSELSRFLLFGVALVPFLGYKLYVAFRKSKPLKDQKLLTYLLIGSIIPLALLSVRAFIPYGDRAYKFFQIDGILPARLLIGVGIINLILIIIALRLPSTAWQGRKSLIDKPAFAVFAYTFVIGEISLLGVKTYYHPPSVGLLEVTGISLLIAIIVSLISCRVMACRYIGLSVMLVYSIALSFPVNPLYRGSGALTESDTAKQIRAINNYDDSVWISTKTTLNPLIIASGAKALSGVQIYPKNEVWKEYFPGEEEVYNRYAHITYRLDDSIDKRSIQLAQPDAFEISLSSCDQFLKDENVNYILAAGKFQEYECFKVVKDSVVGDSHVTIYKRSE